MMGREISQINSDLVDSRKHQFKKYVRKVLRSDSSLNTSKLRLSNYNNICSHHMKCTISGLVPVATDQLFKNETAKNAIIMFSKFGCTPSVGNSTSASVKFDEAITDAVDASSQSGVGGREIEKLTNPMKSLFSCVFANVEIDLIGKELFHKRA